MMRAEAEIDIEKFREVLIRAVEKLNLPPLEEKIVQDLAVYYEKIIEANERINLTAITGAGDFAIKNVVDSLLAWDGTILPAAPAVNYIDVGTGAGFPAVPLALAHPEISATLLDARQKRLAVVEKIVADNLPALRPRLKFLHGRAEEIGKDSRHREKYDFATARAVGKTAILAEYLLPLLKVGGVAVLLKGPGGEEEFKAAEAAIKKLGGKTAAIKKLALPTAENDQRTIIYLEKRKSASCKF